VDFFTRQEQSRRTTRYLIVLFAAAFFSVALATAIVVALLFQFMPAFDQPMLSTSIGNSSQYGLMPFLATIGIVVLLMLIASAGRSAMLSRGGATVARMLGGTEIHGDSKDPLHRRFVNVVEEMSIAAGVPVPDIFVLESESGINAFAAGLEQSDAAVAVTRGALERLNRAELQGVVAHEFSHILNGDMRINQRLMGFSFGILVLALAGRWMLRSMRFARRSRNSKGSIAVVLGIALAVIGSIGVFFSRIIKAAVSRQREMLADASAVQFTRQPDGLAGALKKIGGFSTEFTSAEAEEVAHMLFGRGASSFRGWFATHPPIIDRIRALEPNFREEDLVRLPEQAPLTGSSAADEHAQVQQFAEAAGAQSPDVAVSVEDAGRIESADVGAAIHAAIPLELRDAAHSHEASWLLVVALLCSDESVDQRVRQSLLEQRLGSQRTAMCLRMAHEVAQLDIQLRLPLLELCMPALRQRPDSQLQFLLDLIADLTAEPDSYGLFSFVLPRVLVAWLGERAATHARAPTQRMRGDAALSALLAAVASFGHGDPDSATAAWRAGLAAVNSRIDADTRTLEPHDTDTLRQLDVAVETLRHKPARTKRGVLTAVLVTIRYDHQVRTEEIELFRAIAATLNVPAPPLAAGVVT
jgi:Zn-dependent protease with chaperone function